MTKGFQSYVPFGFLSFELSMETFPVGAGGVLLIFVKRMIKWQCLVVLANE